MGEPARFEITQKLLLRRDDGAVLVLRDAATGLGDLPGGRLETGELNDLRGALRRELAEELGDDTVFELGDEPTGWCPHHIVASGMEALAFIWTGRYSGGAVRLSPEHDGMDWLQPDADGLLPLTPTLAIGAARWLRT